MAETAQEKGVEPAAIEVWFADEARIGQKNKITRRWHRRGTRPATVQYCGDEPAPGRNRPSRRTRSACGAPRGPGGMAPVASPRYPAEHHHCPPAAQVPRT